MNDIVVHVTSLNENARRSLAIKIVWNIGECADGFVEGPTK